MKAVLYVTGGPLDGVLDERIPIDTGDVNPMVLLAFARLTLNDLRARIPSNCDKDFCLALFSLTRAIENMEA